MPNESSGVGSGGEIFLLNKSIYDSPTKFEVAIAGPISVTPQEMVIALKNINIPQFNDESIETFSNNEWRFARGRTSIFQIQMTFKNTYGLNLYTRFMDFMAKAQGLYPSQQFFSITVTYTGTHSGQERRGVTFHKCMLSNMSDLTFDHSLVHSTMDFSIGFKTSEMAVL